MKVQLEIRHLRLLTTIASEGSVTRAAHQLHVTQSALSHQLRDAEERLGTRLFLRVGKKMILTPAGNYLREAAQRLLQDLSRAEEQVSNLDGCTGGVIRLSTECYTCYHWLPPLLKRFHGKFPRVEVSIDANSTHHPIEALLAGKLDVAIVSCPPKNKNLLLNPICEDELVMVLPTGHRLCASKYVRFRDLAGETILIYPPREESTLLQKYMLPAGVEPREALEIPLTEAMIEMIASGMGVALLAQWAVAPQAKAGRVCTRPLTARGVQRTWYAATLRGQPCSPYLSEFVELLAKPCPGALWPAGSGLGG
jgi:LysR family transcriptional regulator, regulator for metE and metH